MSRDDFETDHLESVPEADYVCPSCGEVIVVPVDPSAGSRQTYVEDCPVCCRPNLLHVVRHSDGSVEMTARPE